jgi:glutamate N-acetyltransferase / amino-acid N-acetyltransferase
VQQAAHSFHALQTDAVMSLENSSERSVLQGNQPVAFERSAAPVQFVEHPVVIAVRLGAGAGSGQAWGCDLSYDYVKINAEYTT